MANNKIMIPSYGNKITRTTNEVYFNLNENFD
jgi:hypothetical protein